MISYEVAVAEVESYLRLFHYIRDEVIPHTMILPVAQVTKKLEAFISSKGKALRTDTKKNQNWVILSLFSQMIRESCS